MASSGVLSAKAHSIMEEHQKETVVFGCSLHSSHATGRPCEQCNLEATLGCSRISVDFWSLFIILRRLLLLTLAFSLLHSGLAEVQSELELEDFFLPFIISFSSCSRRCCTQNNSEESYIKG